MIWREKRIAIAQIVLVMAVEPVILRRAVLVRGDEIEPEPAPRQVVERRAEPRRRRKHDVGVEAVVEDLRRHPRPLAGAIPGVVEVEACEPRPRRERPLRLALPRRLLACGRFAIGPPPHQVVRVVEADNADIRQRRVVRRLAGVGAKAAQLARLARLGLPVPAGFVITDAALQEFLDHNSLRTEVNAVA